MHSKDDETDTISHTHRFIEERDDILNDNNTDHICIRFIRRKFKCIVIFILATIAIIELLNNIISKIDETTVEYIVNHFINKTTQNSF